MREIISDVRKAAGKPTPEAMMDPVEEPETVT
jgi:hypothetical protein